MSKSKAVFVLHVYDEGYPALFGVYATEASAKQAAIDEASEFHDDGARFGWQEGGDGWGVGEVLFEVSDDGAPIDDLSPQFLLQEAEVLS